MPKLDMPKEFLEALLEVANARLNSTINGTFDEEKEHSNRDAGHAKLRNMLQQNPALANSVDTNYNHETTALHWGIYHPDTVKLLHEFGVDIHARNSHGATPLMHAARESLGATVLLVALGADINAEYKDIAKEKTTALSEAMKSRKQSTVSYLLSRPGIDVRGFAFPLLNQLVINDDAKNIKALVAVDNSLLNEHIYGRTALHQAAEFGKIHAVAALLELGIDTTIRKNGWEKKDNNGNVTSVIPPMTAKELAQATLADSQGSTSQQRMQAIRESIALIEAHEQKIHEEISNHVPVADLTNVIFGYYEHHPDSNSSPSNVSVIKRSASFTNEIREERTQPPTTRPRGRSV